MQYVKKGGSVEQFYSCLRLASLSQASAEVSDKLKQIAMLATQDCPRYELVTVAFGFCHVNNLGRLFELLKSHQFFITFKFDQSHTLGITTLD